MSHLVNDLIGVPFVDDGRDLSGLDCWGLVMLVLARMGKQIPDYRVRCDATDEISQLVDDARASAAWKPVAAPAPGDLVAIRADSRIPDAVQHFGVYLGEGRFIHVMQKHGVAIVRISDRFWNRRIEG
ncbi:MAG TPA: NlpC/P60 family protein, partial [Acidobacteriota bacterium]|nr:NlpC/P60 family protein [Acidobacteriota bacterium]